jgi:hypothetical protein
VDQRGLPRVEVAGDTACDIGAFEVQPPPPIAAAPSPSPSPTASIAPVALPRAGEPGAPSPGGVPCQLIIPTSVAAAGALVATGRARSRKTDS